MPYHLPILLNPLVNAVFNCPNPNDSNLKKLFLKIANESFMLLVPSSDKLLNYEDLESGSPLRDLCYTVDFVASHILLIDQPSTNDIRSTSSPQQQFEFNTLNDKKIILRPQNRILLTADGFSDKKRHKILDVELFTNFNDYLVGSSKVPLIYIDEPLYGNLVKRDNLTAIEGPKGNKYSSSSEDKKMKSRTTFENIMRVHSDWLNKFNSLFNEYRKESAANDPHEALFHEIINQSYDVMIKEDLFLSMPDLRDFIYDYVEVNLYDDIWLRIKSYFKPSDMDTESLQSLSLSQLDNDLYLENFEKFNLENVVAMEKNILRATNSFCRLGESHTYVQKSTVLIETLQNLSESSPKPEDDIITPMVMDADLLLSCFVLVVCRSQVKNLKSHLYYLRKFAPDESTAKFGVLGYAISTLEAVVFYFEDVSGTKKFENLKASCVTTQKLVKSLTGSVKGNLADFTKNKLLLRYRTSQGESILSLCIIHGKNEELIMLLKNETAFPLEDILQDKNLDDCTLLVQALKHGNISAALIIANIVLSSCTRREIVDYFNNPDCYDRTAAHYLTHEIGILRDIGHYINWKHKDNNGQTPLFTIFRSYDQPNYQEMAEASYLCARKWYAMNSSQFCFFDHEDRKGNTLLHILRRNAAFLLDTDDINVNASNKKGLTPLMVFVKYNRVENVKAILADERTLLWKAQFPVYLTCFDYARNPTVLHELAKISAQNIPFGLALVHSLKFENAKWMLHVTIKTDEKDVFQTVKLPIRLIQSLFRIVAQTYPMSFVPLEESFEPASNLSKMRITPVGKIETLHLNNVLTECLNALIYIGELQRNLILDEASLSCWIRLQNKKQNNIAKYHMNRKNMEPEKMNIVQNFLRFNHAELLSVKSKLQVLKKLAIFNQLKSRDVSDAYELFRRYAEEYLGRSGIHLIPSFNRSFTGVESSMIILIQEIDFLNRCTDRLYGLVGQVLHVSIPKWWRIYSELLELHKQYAQNFPHLVKPNMPSSDDGILSKLLEGKRAKFEKRLSENITDCRRSLREIGGTIFHEHELLAEELSRYMDFRKSHVEEMIRKWVREHIKVLREQAIEMQRIQYQRINKDQNKNHDQKNRGRA